MINQESQQQNDSPWLDFIKDDLNHPKEKKPLRDLSIPNLTPRYFLPVPLCFIAVAGLVGGSLFLIFKMPLDPLIATAILSAINLAVWVMVSLLFRKGTSLKRTLMLLLIGLPLVYAVASCIIGIAMLISEQFWLMAMVLDFFLAFAYFFLCRKFKFIDANAVYLFSLAMVTNTAILTATYTLMILLFLATGEYFQ